MGLLLEGELEFFVGDEHVVAHAGDMWRIPGGVRHKVIAGEVAARALDVFHPIREDYL
jgi:quercetin dioxygenase-like cupin family protein